MTRESSTAHGVKRFENPVRKLTAALLIAAGALALSGCKEDTVSAGPEVTSTSSSTNNPEANKPSKKVEFIDAENLFEPLAVDQINMELIKSGDKEAQQAVARAISERLKHYVNTQADMIIDDMEIVKQGNPEMDNADAWAEVNMAGFVGPDINPLDGLDAPTKLQSDDFSNYTARDALTMFGLNAAWPESDGLENSFKICGLDECESVDDRSSFSEDSTKIVIEQAWGDGGETSDVAKMPPVSFVDNGDGTFQISLAGNAAKGNLVFGDLVTIESSQPADTIQPSDPETSKSSTVELDLNPELHPAIAELYKIAAATDPSEPVIISNDLYSRLEPYLNSYNLAQPSDRDIYDSFTDGGAMSIILPRVEVVVNNFLKDNQAEIEEYKTEGFKAGCAPVYMRESELQIPSIITAAEFFAEELRVYYGDGISVEIHPTKRMVEDGAAANYPDVSSLPYKQGFSTSDDYIFTIFDKNGDVLGYETAGISMGDSLEGTARWFVLDGEDMYYMFR